MRNTVAELATMMTDRVEDMAAFAAVAQAGGFTAAATRLDVSKSRLSRQVSALEARLGVRLLHRTTRATSLTDAGAAYLAHATRLLEDMAEAEDAVRSLGGALAGTIRIAAPLTFGIDHVAPAVQRFMAAHPAVLVDASAVEVVDEMESTATAKPDGTSSLETPKKLLPFSSALTEKGKRQKIIEESFAAYAIKNQMKPTVASFTEDTFSPLVDSLFLSRDPGLSLSSLRCRRMQCKFCGLTDVALGSPLVRVPDEDEWDGLIPHTARLRRTHLVAEMPSDLTSSGNVKLISLTIKVDGDLFSAPVKDLSHVSKDGAMLEFTPRAERAFQDELRFRYENGLPFVTGSLSAHEGCAIVVHNARKDERVQKYKVRQAEQIENDAGMTCGRTLEIGNSNGRSFWKFDIDSDSLFVCTQVAESASASAWHHYDYPESVASVIVSLGRDPIVKELKRCYPAAHKMINDKTWSDRLWKRRYPNVAKLIANREAVEPGDTGTEDVSLQVEGGFDVSCNRRRV